MLDTAIPCGLIVTELVSNCFKHAFPTGEFGEIVISLRADDSGSWTLAVGDNGVGLPKNLDPANTESLGLQLVHSLATQLEAILTIRGDGGALFEFRFSELTTVD